MYFFRLGQNFLSGTKIIFSGQKDGAIYHTIFCKKCYTRPLKLKSLNKIESKLLNKFDKGTHYLRMGALG